MNAAKQAIRDRLAAAEAVLREMGWTPGQIDRMQDAHQFIEDVLDATESHAGIAKATGEA